MSRNVFNRNDQPSVWDPSLYQFVNDIGYGPPPNATVDILANLSAKFDAMKNVQTAVSDLFSLDQTCCIEFLEKILEELRRLHNIQALAVLRAVPNASFNATNGNLLAGNQRSLDENLSQQIRYRAITSASSIIKSSGSSGLSRMNGTSKRNDAPRNYEIPRKRKRKSKNSVGVSQEHKPSAGSKSMRNPANSIGARQERKLGADPKNPKNLKNSMGAVQDHKPDAGPRNKKPLPQDRSHQPGRSILLKSDDSHLRSQGRSGAKTESSKTQDSGQYDHKRSGKLTNTNCFNCRQSGHESLACPRLEEKDLFPPGVSRSDFYEDDQVGDGDGPGLSESNLLRS